MNTPWYKEPWAWLVFFLPFSAVVAGIATYFIANHEPDTLVIGEYYKKGKAINLEISKIKQAKKLGITFGFKLADNKLVIKPTGIEKVFPLLNISFFHPTQAQKDFHLRLTPDGSGYFRHTFADEVENKQTLTQTKLAGKWHVTLNSFEEKWKIQSTVYLPQTEFVMLAADVSQAK
jgi:hypothetical protein